MRKKSEDDGAYTTPSGKRITRAEVIAGARRSTRERRAPSEWWKASALAFVVPEDQLTFSAATKGEDSESWKYWRSISPRCDLRTRVTRMYASCHIPLTCYLCNVAHYTCITHDVDNYT